MSISEKIESSIVQHCATFAKGHGHCDLTRDGEEWAVKVCKDSGLTINQSKTIHGEHYIVVNYNAGRGRACGGTSIMVTSGYLSDGS